MSVRGVDVAFGMKIWVFGAVWPMGDAGGGRRHCFCDEKYRTSTL